jgi:hypothetical protein
MGSSMADLYAEFIWKIGQIINQWRDGSLVPIVYKDQGSFYWRLPVPLADNKIGTGPFSDAKTTKREAAKVLKTLKQFEEKLIGQLFTFTPGEPLRLDLL